MSDEAAALPAGAPVTPVTFRYASYALIIIFAANFFSYLDRQIVSALEEQLKGAFALTKPEFGGLWTAFTVGYMVFAPVIGFLVQKVHRPRVLASCIFVWSLATVWSGWAGTKAELFAARFLIGIGEAGCLVIGPTLLADFFPKEMRGRVLAIFFLGLPLGGTAGYLVAAAFENFFGVWREAFYAAGLPGLALAGLVWVMLDPPRGGGSGGGHGHGQFHGIKPYLQLFKNRTLLLIILAQAFAVIILVPLLHFGVRFLELKYFAGDKFKATLSIGGISLVAGGLGNWLSGVIGDRLARRMKGAYALLAGVAYITGAPFLILGFSTLSVPLMLGCLTMGAFCFFLCMPAVNTQIANSVSFQVRAMAYALAVFILHLLGDTLAPLVFGSVDEARHAQILSELRAEPGLQRLGYAPALAAGALGVTAITLQETEVPARQFAYVIFSCSLFLAGTCSLLAMRTARRDEALAEHHPSQAMAAGDMTKVNPHF